MLATGDLAARLWRLMALDIPAFMALALGVCVHVVLALEPLGAFDAVMATKPWKIFCIFALFVLSEMARGVQVRADLVEASVGSC